MRINAYHWTFLVCALVSFSAPVASAAGLNTIELQYARSALTSGYRPWNDVNLLNYFGEQANRFILEADYKNHFGEGAGVFGFTNTRTYNELWYQDFSTSFSTNNSNA